MEAARLLVRGEFQSDDATREEGDRLAEQFAFFGMQPDSDASPDVETFYLWPENVDAFELFESVRTQWRHGGLGATGLDYAAVLAHMRVVLPRLRKRKFDELYAAVRAMERAALEAFAQLRAAQGS